MFTLTNISAQHSALSTGWQPHANVLLSQHAGLNQFTWQYGPLLHSEIGSVSTLSLPCIYHVPPPPLIHHATAPMHLRVVRIWLPCQIAQIRQSILPAASLLNMQCTYSLVLLSSALVVYW